MHIVESSISAGMTTEDAVKEASLLHLEQTQYSAKTIRLEAAILVDSYEGRMAMRLNRSNSRTQLTETHQTAAKRKRRKEGQKRRKDKRARLSQNSTVDLISLGT